MANSLKEGLSGGLFSSSGSGLKYGDSTDDSDEDSKCCCKECAECCPSNPTDMIITGFDVEISGVVSDEFVCSSSTDDCTGFNTVNDSFFVPNTNTTGYYCASGSIYFCTGLGTGGEACEEGPICVQGTLGVFGYREWMGHITINMRCTEVDDGAGGYYDAYRLSGSVNYDGDSISVFDISDELPQQCIGYSASKTNPGGTSHGRCDFLEATMTITTV